MNLKTTPCKGCSKPIVFAVLSDGKRVPLDPRPPVYDVTEYPDGTYAATRSLESMVSHFATCPKANDFSRRPPKSDAVR